MSSKPEGRMPGTVIALGLVSLFMDTSSELIHSLLPVYLTTVLGIGVLSLGIIEGVAEAAAYIAKVFSGIISDYLGKRKLLAVLGYGLAALTKPMFPLANTVGMVLAARFLDRIGKGIRGAPRDALVADVTPPKMRGAAYGLRQSLDTVGAFAGPLLAIGLMALMADQLRSVLWFAVIPAVIAVAVLLIGVREPARSWERKSFHSPIRRTELQRLGGAYWGVVLIGAVFSLARFSEAFLVLRASDVGVSVGFVPLIMVAMSLVYSLSAYPAGWLSDRIPRTEVLALGFFALMVADVILATAQAPSIVLIGAGVWGLHMGLSQGILSTLVADAVPADLRGTAFGFFNLVSGVALLGASVIAGALWELFGPSTTFFTGSGLAVVALVGLQFRRRNG